MVFLEGITVPLIFHCVWIFLVNAIVIVLSRRNNRRAHKKHLLQLLLILYIHFLFGSPKMQSPNGILALICIIQLLFYFEFTSYTVIYSLSPI